MASLSCDGESLRTHHVHYGAGRPFTQWVLAKLTSKTRRTSPLGCGEGEVDVKRLRNAACFCNPRLAENNDG